MMTSTEMLEAKKAIDELRFALEAVRGGVWSWEDNGGGSWTLYSNRHAPIDPTRPARFGNVQHGYNILATSPDGFDVTGAELRAFIVAAHERLPAVLDGIEAERKAWARLVEVEKQSVDDAFRGETKGTAVDLLEARQALRNMGVDVDALTADA